MRANQARINPLMMLLELITVTILETSKLADGQKSCMKCHLDARIFGTNPHLIAHQESVLCHG